MRTLIVDDSNFIRTYIKQLLQRMGVICAEAADGAEAIAVLQESQSFDLMLVDMNMPVMDGLACVKNIRDAGLAMRMKIVMVTTEMDHDFMRNALERGADDFLMKPFAPQGLREKLLTMGFEGLQEPGFNG